MNPFTLNYHPDYFCNREAELNQLKENLTNGRNTLLHSPRRLGKSALIRHLFHHFEQNGEFETIFVDLFATRNMEELIKVFTEKILEKYHKKNFVEGISKLLKGISPELSFSQDGTPKISLNINESQQESTLSDLFRYLETRKKKVIVAFDEFQVIANYPQKAEAILRTHIQELQNILFVFSGSSNHLLQQMFYSAKRPFYQSSEVMVLEKIEREAYQEFILRLFSLSKKKTEEVAIQHLLDFSEVYTYYTQAIFNQAFYKTEKKLTLENAYEIAQTYLENRKADYQSLLSLLPANQQKMVIAVAKNDVTKFPTSIDFIMQHKLPSVSSVSQAINALVEKEIVYKTNEGYTVYDVFFKRFLQKYY